MGADEKPPEAPQVDLSALLEAEIERRVAARLGVPQAPRVSMTVNQVIALHIEKKLIKQRPEAQRSMKCRFRALSRKIGERDVLSLNHDSCDDYIAVRMKEGGVARTTAGQELQALVTAIRFAVKRSELPYNPISGFDFDLQTGERSRAYTEEEIDALIDAANRCNAVNRKAPFKYIRAVVLCMRNTGIRPKELLTSKKADLNWATGSLQIPKTVAKSKKARRCVIWPDALDALREISRPDSPWLFPSPLDPFNRISKAAINLQWRKIADVAQLAPDDNGKPAQLYSMRGTLATRLGLDENMEDQRLMAAMGWESTAMARKYVRRGERQMLEEAARLQASALERQRAAKRPPATVTSIIDARLKSK